VLDAFEGFASSVDGQMQSSSHRRGLKVWFDDAKKEHYEAQLIKLPGGVVGLEIGFHSEHPKDDDNQAVLDRLIASEAAWREQLGAEAEAGMFLGADRWRRISEVWDAPDPDDPESSIEIAARLADYVIAIEPLRRI
jgi:hypothetical protein